MTAAKIFVEPTEDLSFIFAKIVKSGADQVLLIIPEGTNFNSSKVSLKLLARMLSRTRQQLVLIQDDPVGVKYAREAGLISREKVSDVEASTWEEAVQLKENLLRKRDTTKMELLSQRQEQDYKLVENPKQEKEAEVTPLIINSTDPELEATPEVDVQTPVVAPEMEAISETTDTELEAGTNEEVKPYFKKMEPKLIDLDEYAILSGGDIADYQQASELKQKLARLDQLMPLKTKASNQALAEQFAGETKDTNRTEPPTAAEIEDQTGSEISTEEPQLSQSTSELEPEPKQNFSTLLGAIGLKGKMLVGNLKAGLISGVNKIKTRRSNKPSSNLVGSAKSQDDGWIPRSPTETSSTTPENIEPLAGAEPKKNSDFVSHDYQLPKLTNYNFANKTHIPKREPITRRSSFSNYDQNRPRFSERLAPLTNLWLRLKERFTKESTDNANKTGKTGLSASSKKKIGIGVAIALLLFLLLSIFVFPSAKVTLKMKQTSVPVTQELIANKDLASLDLAQMQIPLKEVSKTNTRSDTADATGKGVSGDKASGTVSILNSTNAAITIKANTVITLVGKNLDYVINNEVSVPASGSVQNIGIAASALGDNYNQATSAKKDFAVKTNPPAGISIFTYNEIKGGTSVETKVVSQSDFDGLKNELVNNLKESLKSDLKELVSKNEVQLVAEPIFTEPQVTAEKKVGTQTETFDISVSIGAKIPVVNKADLTEVIKEIATRNSPLQGDFTINSITDPIVSEVKLQSSNSSFIVDSTAQLIAKVDQKTVKKQIAGLGATAAIEKLQSLPDIEKAQLDYSPAYLPQFLRRLPGDDGKISLIIEK